jgi:hypothetical protein
VTLRVRYVMADLVAVQQVTNVSIGTSQVTLIQIKAPTNQRVKITEISVSFAGTTNTNAPIQVQGMIQTTAGTASAGTPKPTDGDVQETIQTSTQITFTGEPTYSSILRSWYVHPQTGIVVPLSLKKPIVLKGGTYFGLVVLAANAVAGSAYIEFEE